MKDSVIGCARAGLSAAIGAILALAVLLSLATAAAAQADGIAALSWPETKQAIQDGAEVTLGESFGGGPETIPCQADAPATVVFNGLSTDSASATAPSSWYECGSLAVGGGFTAVQLSPQEIRASAEPAITLTEPGGCVYQLSQVAGHEALQGRLAVYEVVGSATLTRGAPCAHALEIKGSLGLFGPQSGGIGVLPWTAIDEREKEAFEKDKLEREQKRTGEGQQHPPEATEREARERHDAQLIVESLSADIAPKGKSRKLAALLKVGAWSASFSTPAAGELVVSWYELPAGAYPSAKARPVLVAKGRAIFSAPGSEKVLIRLTSAGRRLLHGARRVKLNAEGRFKPTGKPALAVLKTFVLKR